MRHVQPSGNQVPQPCKFQRLWWRQQPAPWSGTSVPAMGAFRVPSLLCLIWVVAADDFVSKGPASPSTAVPLGPVIGILTQDAGEDTSLRAVAG
eukprot:1199645-Prymnesium_polylepis.1